MYKISLFLVSLLAVGCTFTQDPAPVISGQSRQFDYDQENRVQMRAASYQLDQAKQLIEPDTTQISYVVQRGDSLYSVAKQFEVPVKELAASNRLSLVGDLIVGQVLLIPEANNVVSQRQDGAMVVGRSQPVLKAMRRVEPPKVQITAPAVERPVVTEPTFETEATAIKYITHQVKRGETLYRISKRYNASVIDIMSANHFDKPQDLIAGGKIKVPVASSQTVSDETEVRTIDRNLAKAKGFVWPAKGNMIRNFGAVSDGVSNTGINIMAPRGTPIVAADNGTVIYADDGLDSYGNLILIRHERGVVTAYAHNSKNMVKRGESIEKGQVIALVGDSGNVDRPQLHFEVRRNARAINPLTVLPKN